MDKNPEIFALIKSIACKYLPGAKVMLFGSRARKDNALDSDYDILVVSPQEISPKQKIPLKTNIRKDLLKAGVRSDILIQSRKEVNKNKKLPGHIVKTIMHEAVLL